MSLCWDSHPSHLKTMLVGMMTSSAYTDVTLVCGDQVQFKAHKVVLSASSPVMRNILENNNTDNPLIYLRGVQHEDMEAILQFIYLGEATVKQGRKEEFFKLARDFEIENDLIRGREKSYISTEPNNSNVNPLEELGASNETITSDIEMSINVKEEPMSETENDYSCEQGVTTYDSDRQHDDYEEFDLDFIGEEGEINFKEEADDVSYNPKEKMTSRERTSRLKYSRSNRFSFDDIDISGLPFGKDCKICGHSTQRRMRMLKHYCTVHFTDELTKYFDGNRCTICGNEFFSNKVSSMAIHVGLQHKVIQQLLNEGGNGCDKTPTKRRNSPSSKTRNAENPKAAITSDVGPLVPWHDKSSSSEGMKRIQSLGNSCLQCGKEFKLFRSSLLPHYCGHFFSQIAKHIEPFFTDDKCNLCGSFASQRKSKVIHLGTTHELVLKFIENITTKTEQESGVQEKDTTPAIPLDVMNKTC